MEIDWIWGAADHGRDGWELVSDQVMGGVSTGTLTLEDVAGRRALHMVGEVSLENDGGFLQIARDMAPAGGWTGVAVTVLGPPASYNLHLRTTALERPWQSFRASFDTTGAWQTVNVPFHALTPHRTRRAFEPERLCRLGLVAIGRAFCADLSVARLGLMRD